MRCQKTIEKQGVYCSAAREAMTQSGCITCPWGAGGDTSGLIMQQLFSPVTSPESILLSKTY